MTTIKEIYEDTRTEIEFEEFKQKVEARSKKMGAIVDEESAALLIAQEVGDDSVKQVDDISPEDEDAEIVGKITSIGEIKEFDQSSDNQDNSDTDNDSTNGDGDSKPDSTAKDTSKGKVINITVADQTGSIKSAFWYSKADTVKEQYTVGDNVRISGEPREGYNSTEISADSISHETDITVDVKIGEGEKIGNLTQNHEMTQIEGIVLSTSDINEFTRDDGSKGQVSNIILGDETGHVNIALWGDAAPLGKQRDVGNELSVNNISPRINDGELEINVGNPEKIQQINKGINYDPDTADINEVTKGNRVTISGDLVYVGEPNKFNRDDGSEGVVQNIEIKDDTGQIRAALWGNNILGPDPNADSVTLLNAEIKRGYEDNLEANVGYNATVVLSNKINSSDNSNRQGGREDTTKTGDERKNKKDNQPEDAVKTDTPPGLKKKSPSVEENIEETEDEQIDQENTQEAEEDKKSNQTRSSEFELSVTGVVLGTGDEITLDTTEERLTVIPPNDVDVSLGQEVTVRGKKVDKGIKADEIF